MTASAGAAALGTTDIVEHPVNQRHVSLCYVIPVFLLRAPHSRFAGQEALCRAEGERWQPEVLHRVEGDAHGGPVHAELVELLPYVEKKSGEAEDDEGGLEAAPALPAINHGYIRMRSRIWD